MQEIKFCTFLYENIQFANYNMTPSMLIWSQEKHVKKFMLEHKRHGIVNEVVTQLNKHRDEMCALREVHEGENEWWTYNHFAKYDRSWMNQISFGHIHHWTCYRHFLFRILLKKLHDFKWDSIDHENCIIKPKKEVWFFHALVSNQKMKQLQVW